MANRTRGGGSNWLERDIELPKGVHKRETTAARAGRRAKAALSRSGSGTTRTANHAARIGRRAWRDGFTRNLILISGGALLLVSGVGILAGPTGESNQIGPNRPATAAELAKQLSVWTPTGIDCAAAPAVARTWFTASAPINFALDGIDGSKLLLEVKDASGAQGRPTVAVSDAIDVSVCPDATALARAVTTKGTVLTINPKLLTKVPTFVNAGAGKGTLSVRPALAALGSLHVTGLKAYTPASTKLAEAALAGWASATDAKGYRAIAATRLQLAALTAADKDKEVAAVLNGAVGDFVAGRIKAQLEEAGIDSTRIKVTIGTSSPGSLVQGFQATHSASPVSSGAGWVLADPAVQIGQWGADGASVDTSKPKARRLT